jgi:uncharacterized protein (TIGR03083 family)
MAADVAQLMEQAWSSFEEVCSQITGAEWDLPTDCPGWTVKDQLAHIAAIEGRLLGRPGASGEPVEAPHVRNPLGAVNEQEIGWRRARAPEELLEEYREVSTGRAKALAEVEDWTEKAQGVLGEAPMTEIVSVRVLDVFYHEQDIRVATGKPGHMSGDVARFVFERMANAMPFVVGKRAAATDGQTVAFDIGPPGRAFAVGMKDGRGVALDAPPGDPTVSLSMDGEAFLRLCGGRWSAQGLEKEGRLRVEGDRGLADRVLDNIAITP